MKTIERKQLELEGISPHALNRGFETSGAEWDEFEDDVAARGIQEDLVVRLLEDGTHQCLRGHRRRLAGLRRKIRKAWCVVVECGDEEAFDHMWGGNLFREACSAADEAQAVRVKVETFGKTPAAVAAEWHRSLEWVRTRQGLLDLGEEVLSAVGRKGQDRLTIGAVEEILKVPEAMRPEAVQLVLHPEFQPMPLNEDQARDVIHHGILKPAARAAEWDEARGALKRAWREDLERLCLPGTAEDLQVSAKPCAEAERLVRGYVAATEKVDLARVLPAAPHGLRWLHLAVKHGLAVQLVPEDGPEKSKAVVEARMIEDAEAAAAEHGSAEVWLCGRKRTVSVDRGAEMGEERARKAQADLEAGYDTGVDVEEKPETVIEQTMERCAMIRIGEVERLRDWAGDSSIDGGEPWPEFVPKWADKLVSDGTEWKRMLDVCDWVLGLKV